MLKKITGPARSTLLFALVAVLFGTGVASLTGCRAETNEDGAQVELGDPD